MIYDVRQTTTCAYGSHVPYAAHVLRLMPLADTGVDVLARDMFIDPAPSELSATRDFFGNATTHVTLKTPHKTAHGRDAVHGAPQSSAAWRTRRFSGVGRGGAGGT